GAELAREAGAGLESGDLPAPLAGLIHSYVEHRFSDADELRGTLYLNAACPLVRRPAERPPPPAAPAAGLAGRVQTGRRFGRAPAVGRGRGRRVRGADGGAGGVNRRGQGVIQEFGEAVRFGGRARLLPSRLRLRLGRSLALPQDGTFTDPCVRACDGRLGV